MINADLNLRGAPSLLVLLDMDDKGSATTGSAPAGIMAASPLAMRAVGATIISLFLRAATPEAGASRSGEDARRVSPALIMIMLFGADDGSSRALN